VKQTSHQNESVLLAALLQQPERWAECLKLKPADLEQPWAKLLVAAGQSFYAFAQSKGVLRWPIREAMERMLTRRLASLRGNQQAFDDFKRRVDECTTMLDILQGWGAINEHEFRDCLDEVKKSCADRHLRNGLLDIANRLQPGVHASAVYQQLAELAGSIAPVSSESPEGTLSADVGGVLARYAQAKTGLVNIPTPFPHLNIISGGGGYGRLWVNAGYTGHGKTQLAKELVYHAAVREGRGAIIFTSEQTKADVECMMVSRHSHWFTQGGLPLDRIMKGRLDVAQEKLLWHTVADLMQPGKYGPISYVQVPNGTTMSEVRTIIDQYSRKHPVDMVMLDHTMLFAPTRRTGNRNDDVAGVIMEAKALSLEYARGRGLWVLACHQIARSGYEEALKRGFYVNSDLAATSETERSADLVMWILRTDALMDTREARLGVSKNRWGPLEVKGWNVVEKFDSAALFPLVELGTP
jgi:replicative DNA helicase